MKEKRTPRGFTDVVKRANSATVVVGLCNYQNQSGQLTFNNLVAHGSGFFVNEKGLLLTAKHVFPNPLLPNQLYFALHRGPTSFWMHTSTALTYDFADIDVCAIKFERETAFLPLAQFIPKQGADIGIFGYPAAHIHIQNGNLEGPLVKPRASRTTISNIEITTMTFGTNRLENKVILESQFIFIKGNSGGPVFDAKTGKVIGLVTGVRHIPQDFQNLTVANGGVTQQIVAFPFASYAYAISISEMIPRLSKSDYSFWW